MGPCRTTPPFTTLLRDPQEELPFTKRDDFQLTHHSPRDILERVGALPEVHRIGPLPIPSRGRSLGPEPQTPSAPTNSSPHFSDTHLSPPASVR